MSAIDPIDAISAGTAQAPKFYAGPSDVTDEVSVSQRYFSYATTAGIAVGKTLSVTFFIDRPAQLVWRYLKDFNLWQNVHHHYYTGVVGDLEGKTFRLGTRPNDPTAYTPYEYRVERVIAQHLIVVSQPLSKEDGAGVIPADFHVFMLNEHRGRTTVSCVIQHAYLPKTEEEGLKRWREVAQKSQMKWRDVFVPKLKALILGEADAGIG